MYGWLIRSTFGRGKHECVAYNLGLPNELLGEVVRPISRIRHAHKDALAIAHRPELQPGDHCLGAVAIRDTMFAKEISKPIDQGTPIIVAMGDLNGFRA